MSNSKGDVFMNRIFKVIWSKTKHCYIVVSEYAKANTKAAHTGATPWEWPSAGGC